jgi:hypothetical protein
VAVFAERTTQIHNIDSDPTNNSQKQVLSNTGTSCPRSVTKFGDSDLVYLDESGLRSIRARDASNSATTSDLGTPVDTLITAKLRALSATQRQTQVISFINPADSRFWLIFPDEIFVFTRFEASKVSAWSTYKPTYYDENGDLQTFTIDDAAIFQRRVYLRGGDKIFCYGGVSTGLQTDDTPAVARLPYLDGGTPTEKKTWDGFDVACRGTWEIRAFMEPSEAGFETSDVIARVTDTTFNSQRLPFDGASTHVSLQFTSQSQGAKLSACAIHFVDTEKDES